MNVRRIDELIRERVAAVDIPAAEKYKYWLRFDSPFCGKVAAISYGAGWFECFHADCLVKAKRKGRLYRGSALLGADYASGQEHYA